jgi:glycosyltransferase involved in cell wall biosynthesis
MSLVSVIVSAFNRPEMLRAALNSVLAQTYKDIEIIVQDDSTISECSSVVATIDDPRIIYTHNQPSLGTIQNLLTGYRRASGDYVCTLNDDDLYLPEYLSTMVDGLERHPACCMAFSDHWIIDADGNVDHALSDKNSANFGRWWRD